MNHGTRRRGTSIFHGRRPAPASAVAAALGTALGALLIGLIPSVALADDAPAPAAPTYSGDVAPILFASCAGCHRPGQIAPMSLLSYEETRPWVKSIRASVVKREMPPWDADPAHGHWANDISLTDAQIDAITKWIDAGAPEGDRAKTPAAPQFAASWENGEPDMVIDLPETKVPAGGEDLFPDQLITLELEADKWIQAVEILPGNREVLHHVVGFLGDAAMGGQAAGTAARTFSPDVAIFAIWAAGMPPTVFPEGMGHKLAKKQVMTFNMHYHPNGNEATDHTRVGLHFGKGEMTKRLKTVAAINAGIHIEPNNAAYAERAVFEFPEDSRIVSLFPHMHLRGREMKYVVTYPDGRTDTLLNVPKYDFNWQWVYYPKEPISAPKGTRIELTALYDNSPANPNNPDPNRTIGFGEGTNDEMMIGFMEIIPEAGVESKTPAAGEYLKRVLAAFPANETYTLKLGGGMLPVAAGIRLPRGADARGEFYLIANAAVIYVPVNGLKWDGDAFACSLPMLGAVLDGKGSASPDGALRMEFTVPEKMLAHPRAGVFGKLMAHMEGRRLDAPPAAPAAASAGGN